MKRFLWFLWLALAAGLAQAQQPVDQSQLRQWLQAGQYGEIESTYTRVLAARTRNRWGEFHSEEIIRVLSVPATTATVAGFNALEAQAVEWLSRALSPLAALVRATVIVRRIDFVAGAAPWSEIETQVRDAGMMMEIARRPGRDPNWHAAYLGVARLEGWENGRLYPALSAAINAEPWALSPYLAAAVALSYDHERGLAKTVEMAEYALRMTRAGDGASMYARILLHSADWFGPLQNRPFASGHMQWPLMHQGLKDLEAQYPSIYLLDHHAALACVAGDKGAAKVLMERIGPLPAHERWEFWGGRALYSRCKEWVKEPDQVPDKVAQAR